MSIIKILMKPLIKASGNRIMQGMLEKNVQVSQYLMGIGAGSRVLISGERAIFNFIKERLKSPYCFFDVGSNKGQFLQLIRDNIEVDDFSIHCFEPSHKTFKMLVESSKEDKRIYMNNIGIGKEKAEAVLHFDNVGSGLASLTKRRLDHFGIDFNKSETVKINTIDNYCSEKAIKRINLLKIDIEGHELDALNGARRMFDKKSIDVVTFEFGGGNIDSRTYFQDFWYLFSEINMKIFRITPAGYLYPIVSYKEIHEQFRTTNFMACNSQLV